MVAGIKLNNYTVSEKLSKILHNQEAHVFTSVVNVGMKTLLTANEDALVKEVIQSADLTVIAEAEILDAVGENTILRKREIDRREFFFQLMKILERNGHTVYILGEKTDETQKARQYLQEEFSRLRLIGQIALEENTGADEGVVNTINMSAPDVVLSILPTPLQEHFYAEHRPMLSAKLWYGLGDHKLSERKHTLGAMLMKKVREKRLKTITEREEK